jgi:hypothetical protein
MAAKLRVANFDRRRPFAEDETPPADPDEKARERGWMQCSKSKPELA